MMTPTEALAAEFATLSDDRIEATLIAWSNTLDSIVYPVALAEQTRRHFDSALRND